MALKTYRPVTPGNRTLVRVDRSGLHKGGPVKRMTRGLPAKGGRNNTGRITVRHQGGRHKRRYRIVDFRRRGKLDVAATVERLEYDPNRSAFLALIRYEDGELAYILAPQRLGIGDRVLSSMQRVGFDPGNAMPLRLIPVGTLVHNVELIPGRGGQIARSAGNYVQIVGRDGDEIVLRLCSGEMRRFDGRCFATVGSVSNPDQQNTRLGKAGRHRWLGVRPSVRGVAMNPVDHPLGGGEGRSSGGRHPVTPWGKPTKGHPTRNRNKASSGRIIRRRKKKK